MNWIVFYTWSLFVIAHGQQRAPPGVNPSQYQQPPPQQQFQGQQFQVGKIATFDILASIWVFLGHLRQVKVIWVSLGHFVTWHFGNGHLTIFDSFKSNTIRWAIRYIFFILVQFRQISVI